MEMRKNAPAFLVICVLAISQMSGPDRRLHVGPTNSLTATWAFSNEICFQN